MKNKNTTTRTYTLPLDLVKRLQSFSKATDRTESGTVRFIIKKFFEEKVEEEK